MRVFATLFLLSSFSFLSFAQDDLEPLPLLVPPPSVSPSPDSLASVPEEPTADPQQTAKTKKDDNTQVSILGYHEFSTDRPNTAMRIQVSKFRKQMEALRDLGLPVISMEQFIAWKRGEAEIPPQSFLITIDDGWKSVYTEAYPVLKELGFPFTLFLYKKYVDGGSRALTSQMINEMLESGLCTIGSHSVSHPFPSKFKAAKKKSPEALQSFLNQELGDSKTFLEKKFGNPIPTYAYPGGYVTEEMFPVAQEQGYEFLFTVNPGMTRHDSNNMILPRFIVLGNRDSLFELATTFRQTTSTGAASITTQTTKHPVIPKPGVLIAERLPLISADLSQELDLDPESLVMRISGFGKVPATWDKENQAFTWKINRPLRVPACQVSVQWKLKEHREYELPMRWSFRIDLEAAYQPR